MSVSHVSGSTPGKSGLEFDTFATCPAPTLLQDGDLVLITIRYQTNITVNVTDVEDDDSNSCTLFGLCVHPLADFAERAHAVYYFISDGTEVDFTVTFDTTTFCSIEASAWRSTTGTTPEIVNLFVRQENPLNGPYIWPTPTDQIASGDCVVLFFFANSETRSFDPPTGGNGAALTVVYEEEASNNREVWYQDQAGQAFIPGFDIQQTSGTPIYTTATYMILRDGEIVEQKAPSDSADVQSGTSGMSVSPLPPPVTGYQLDAPWSFWSSIVPQEATNLIKNPSFETGVSGIAISGWNTITTLFDDTPEGFTHLQLSGPAGSAAYVYQEFDSEDAGLYIFSAYIYHSAGQVFTLEFRDNVNATIESKAFLAARSGWSRRSIRTSLAADITYRATISVEDSGESIKTDGWMVEETSTESTYFDGSHIDQSHRASGKYLWKSLPNLSQSVRSVSTRDGGRIVSWALDAMFRTTAIQGLELPDADIFLPVLSSGREIMTGRNPVGRDVRILGRIFGCTHVEMQRKASEFIRLLKPHDDSSTQRTVIRFTPLWTSGEEFGKTLVMYATNVSGVTGNFTNWFQHEFGVDVRLSDPKLYEEIWTSQEIDYNAAGGSDTFVGDRDAITGRWSFLPDSGATTGGYVGCIEHINDDQILAGGTFSSIANVSATRIGIWSPAGWAEAGPGLSDEVWDIVQATLTDVYISGDFLTDGAAAGTYRRFIKYDIDADTFTEMDGGLESTPIKMALHNSGIFIAGTFTENATSTRTNLNGACLFGFDLDQFEDLDQGVGGAICRTVVIGPDNNAYFGGDFIVVGSGALSAKRVAMWNTQTSAWEALGQGFGNGSVYTLAFDNNGVLYAGGSFTLDGDSATLENFAKWDGISWRPVFSEGVSSVVREIVFDKHNHMYVSCSAAIAGNSVPSYINGFVAKVINGQWVNVDFQTTGWVRDFDLSNDGRLAIAINTGGWGASAAAADGTTIDYQGTADAPVKIMMIGPCEVVEIVNHTTSKTIRMAGLILEPDERLYIDLTGTSPVLYTDLRKDVSKFFLNGLSDFNDFRLVPGKNYITCATRGTTDAGTACVISWRNAHWSMSEAYV